MPPLPNSDPGLPTPAANTYAPSIRIQPAPARLKTELNNRTRESPQGGISPTFILAPGFF